MYVGGGDGLTALCRSTGEGLWRVTFGDFVTCSPSVVDGRAFIGSADGWLYGVGRAR